MTGTHLNGLDGTNPLAFLAALGVQILFEREDEQPRLWWSDDVIPHAVIDAEFTVERVVDQAMKVFPRWLESPTLKPEMAPKTDVKFKPNDIRKYLELARRNDPGDALAFSLVAEGSLDNSGKAKPSDLHFTAGRQLFLKMACEILAGVERDDLFQGLGGPWGYVSTLPSLMWDVSDDRLYALVASNPSTDKKLTNPGPEALAVLGLSHLSVFAGRDRTLTMGCSGGWKSGGSYTWPLWIRPAGPGAVSSLLAQVTYRESESVSRVRDRTRWYQSWSIARVLKSNIRRADQGGFGTFGPTETIWSRE